MDIQVKSKFNIYDKVFVKYGKEYIEGMVISIIVRMYEGDDITISYTVTGNDGQYFEPVREDGLFIKIDFDDVHFD